ncbi:alternative oxidase [Nitrincola alkalilacustris]|uniref:alternative oxidase n=1 Tax=Nitrincola alkalilacustris TaxID=1571224 RepID=UPI00124BE2C5|nr:alternative oxidase [Nitrincola alkalilacustris]
MHRTESELPQTLSEDPLHKRHQPTGLSDRVAFGLTKFLRFFADSFFAKRYGHRAVVLETVAGVPGMVGGMVRHMRSLRHLEDDREWIHTLLSEAENERMHLMVFIKIAQPNWMERMIILLAQGIFFTSFFILYIISGRTAHRLVGYFEEEAVYSYTEYLAEVDNGNIPNIEAPQIAIEYWQLPADAKLREVIIAVRNDEAGHRDVNHCFADSFDRPPK